MDDIAASASLTRVAIYHHSGDKIGLFCAVVEEIDEEFDKKIAAAISDISSHWQRFIGKSHTCLQSIKDREITYILMRDGVVVLANMASWPSRIS